jgi:amino acid transporter
VPSCATQLAGIIQQLIATGDPDTAFSTQWQVTLLMFAFTFLIVAFNIWGARHLPLAEGVILFAHIFGFFAFLIIFWVMSDHEPAEKVFTDFYDGGGWGSKGLSSLIGLTSALWSFIGADAGAHMSEELKDASKDLPRAMMWSITLNGILGITMVISFCFCIKDVEAFVNAVRYHDPNPEHRRAHSDHISGFWLPDRRRHLLYHWLLRRDLRPYLVPDRLALFLGGVYGCQLFSSNLELRKRSCKPDNRCYNDRA